MSQINAFLQKAFQSLSSSISIPLGVVAYELVKCGKANSYVETLGFHADSLHSWIKRVYDVDFKRAFEAVVDKALKRLNCSSARLAVDITPEPFYGKSTSLFLFNIDNSKKWNAEFRFIVVSLITRNKQIPLMARPVMVGEGVAKPAIEMLINISYFRSSKYIIIKLGRQALGNNKKFTLSFYAYKIRIKHP